MKTERIGSAIKQIDEKIYLKIHFHIDEMLIVTFVFIGVVLMFARCFYGIDTADEAYYYADTLTVIQGNLPFAYNNSIPVGMTFLMIPFMLLYKLFIPDLTGVFLYMRICYVIFRYTILLWIYFILKRKLERRKLLWAMALYVPYLNTIQAFSYNTISKYMILLSGVIIAFFAYEKTDKERKVNLMLAFAGFVSAIGVFAHVLYAASVFLNVILVAVFSPKKVKMRRSLIYICGGLTEILIVFLPICIQSGIKLTFSGLQGFFSQDNVKGNKINLTASFVNIWNAYGKYWGILLISFSISVIMILLGASLAKKKADKEDMIMIPGSVSALICILYLIITKESLNAYLGAVIIWLAVLSLFIKKDRLYLVLMSSFLVFLVMELFFTTNGDIRARGNFLYPILFGWIWMCFLRQRKSLTILSSGIVLMLSVFLIKEDYGYVYGYGANTIAGLRCPVESGIYKGIYAAGLEAEYIVDLEAYIDTHTEPYEKVAFRDNIPAAYLMHEGKVCDIRTWDPMFYGSPFVTDNNDPGIMYDYYRRTRSIPDKIIYVYYGPQLSVEDPMWKYNEFIETCYKKIEEKSVNKRYRVILYELDRQQYSGFQGIL